VSVTSRIEAVKIIHDCAVSYDENLSGRNVMFVAIDNGKTTFIETLFTPHNFLHLTGVKTRLRSEQFFIAALSKRLSPDHISFDPGGTTELKLEVLPQLMSIHTRARMVGDYDSSRPLLITDKFAGTVTMAMGFVNKDGFYLPNTALKIDIRDITEQAARRRVIAIFTKERRALKYTHLSYIAKEFTIDDNVLASVVREKADKQNLIIEVPKKSLAENLAKAKKKAAQQSAGRTTQQSHKPGPRR